MRYENYRNINILESMRDENDRNINIMESMIDVSIILISH